jgi:hypothetical protein
MHPIDGIRWNMFDGFHPIEIPRWSASDGLHPMECIRWNSFTNSGRNDLIMSTGNIKSLEGSQSNLLGSKICRHHRGDRPQVQKRGACWGQTEWIGWNSSDGMHSMECTGENASDRVHSIECIRSNASERVESIECIGWNASDGLHPMRCIP